MNRNIYLARKLRKNLTDAERKLWQELRRCQFKGFRFRKQVPIGCYIVDFLCYEARLVIEIDGGQHNDPEYIEYDQQRTKWLQEQGYRVQRFWNNEVFREFDIVKEVIWRILDTPLL